MKWAKRSEWVAVSDTMPTYKVAKFLIDDQAMYRGSVGGEFIGRVCGNTKEAQAICENHLQIMGPVGEQSA